MAAHGFMPSILLVKDVPANLPVNISAMEQGWILYRCDRAQAPLECPRLAAASAAASAGRRPRRQRRRLFLVRA